MNGTLFCVAMPIGNVEDLSVRARFVLTKVEVIAAEDTRKLYDWLKRAGIETQAKIIAYHSQNEKDSAKGIIKLLQEQKNVALVSDAGSPRLSDPGYQLLHLAHQEKLTVIPVAGPSALTALLSIAPLPVEPLLFLGFLSPKSGRRKNTLLKYANFEGTIAVYESVHRIASLMKDIVDVYQNPQVFIGRELTKQYEETFWGTAQEALVWLQNKKGEFSFLIKQN